MGSYPKLLIFGLILFLLGVYSYSYKTISVVFFGATVVVGVIGLFTKLKRR